MKTPTTVVKVWYNFLCAKIKPNLHLTTVTKDKTILLYAITQGIKFDVEHIIERGLIESTHGCCTGALIYPSLITQLCCIVEVPYLESKKKVHHRLPLSLPKSKVVTQENMEDEDDEDATSVEQSEEDS